MITNQWWCLHASDDSKHFVSVVSHERSTEAAVIVQVCDVVIWVWFCRTWRQRMSHTRESETWTRGRDSRHTSTILTVFVPAKLLHHLFLCNGSTCVTKQIRFKSRLMCVYWLKCRCQCVKLTFVSLFVHVLGLDEPVHVSDHVLLHLLALLRLLELTAGHSLLSFLGELSVPHNMRTHERDSLRLSPPWTTVLQLLTHSTHPGQDW